MGKLPVPIRVVLETNQENGELDVNRIGCWTDLLKGVPNLGVWATVRRLA